MSGDLVRVDVPGLGFRRVPDEIKRLLLAGRCMAHEMERAGLRTDLVEAWEHCAEDLSGKSFYAQV